MKRKGNPYDLKSMLETLSAAKNMDRVFMGTSAMVYNKYVLQDRSWSNSIKLLLDNSNLVRDVLAVFRHYRGGKRANEVLDQTATLYLEAALRELSAVASYRDNLGRWHFDDNLLP